MSESEFKSRSVGADFYLGSYNVSIFILHLLRRLPDHHWPTAVKDNKPALSIVAGQTNNIFEAYGAWLLADEKLLLEVFERSQEKKARFIRDFLLSEEVYPFLDGMQLPKFVVGLANEIFVDLLKGYKVQNDRHYFSNKALTNDSQTSAETLVRVKRLYQKNYDELKKHDFIRKNVGNMSDFEKEGEFWVWFENDVPVGIAETLVQHEDCYSIQQVLVDESHRRKGIGKRLLTEIIVQKQKEGFDIRTYLVSEKNLPSIRLAESLGFTQFETVGCVQKAS